MEVTALEPASDSARINVRTTEKVAAASMVMNKINIFTYRAAMPTMNIRANVPRTLVSAAFLLLSACAQDPITGQCSAFDKGCKERAIYEAIDGESKKIVDASVQQARLEIEKNHTGAGHFDSAKVAESICKNFSGDSWPVSWGQCWPHAQAYARDSYTEQVNAIYKEHTARLKREKIESDQANAARDAAIKKREQQERARLEADLRSGRVKPANFEQEIYVRAAADGGMLAGSPKIQADGKKYYLSGKVYRANNNALFVASVLPSEIAAIQSILLTGSDAGIESTQYFAVDIPDNLKMYYLSNARIGSAFDVIGLYVDNIDYQTVIGEAKIAPVFKAEYLKFRD